MTGWLLGVVQNLVASALWAAPAGLLLARKLERQHRETMAARNGEPRA